jgi:hypothetical protein
MTRYGKATHANRGKVAEQALDRIHAGYSAAGHYCQRNPTPYKVIGTAPTLAAPGALRVVPERDGPPDWLVVAHGRAWLLDVKSEAGMRFTLAHIPQHQAQALDSWERQGDTFHAGVVVVLDHGAVVAWLPWSWLGARWWRWWATERAAPGVASLSPDELQPWRCGWDWLPAALRVAGVDG